MKIETIGVMSPGDMGQAVAQQLKNKGFKVCTALDQRSARSKTLALQAGLTDVGSVAKLVETCDVILSVMNPGSALEFAGEVAQALAAARRNVLFVDCNAISPVTMQQINLKITAAGGRCADAGIIGPPPRGTAKMTLYVSGPEARELEQLETPQVKVHFLSERSGDASAIKMCYAAMTKGVQALVLELLIAARRLGVDAALEAQIKSSRSDVYNFVIDALPRMPPKAYRWVPETEEIARTFDAVGLTPLTMQGAARMCAAIAETAPGKESPEEARARGRKGVEVVAALDAGFPGRK